MSKNTLDRNKDYATIYGDDQGRVYQQGEHHFRSDGSLWRDPSAKESAAEKKAREDAEKAEADRLAAEALALAKAGGADDQLSKQLG